MWAVWSPDAVNTSTHKHQTRKTMSRKPWFYVILSCNISELMNRHKKDFCLKTFVQRCVIDYVLQTAVIIYFFGFYGHVLHFAYIPDKTDHYRTHKLMANRENLQFTVLVCLWASRKPWGEHTSSTHKAHTLCTTSVLLSKDVAVLLYCTWPQCSHFCQYCEQSMSQLQQDQNFSQKLPHVCMDVCQSQLEYYLVEC